MVSVRQSSVIGNAPEFVPFSESCPPSPGTSKGGLVLAWTEQAPAEFHESEQVQGGAAAPLGSPKSTGVLGARTHDRSGDATPVYGGGNDASSEPRSFAAGK